MPMLPVGTSWPPQSQGPAPVTHFLEASTSCSTGMPRRASTNLRGLKPFRRGLAMDPAAASAAGMRMSAARGLGLGTQVKKESSSCEHKQTRRTHLLRARLLQQVRREAQPLCLASWTGGHETVPGPNQELAGQGHRRRPEGAEVGGEVSSVWPGRLSGGGGTWRCLRG